MMMPPMQKMAAPLALASALCHIATVAVMMNMHIQLRTVQDLPADPHRALLDSDGDSLLTVAHMTKAVDHLQDTLGSRLTATTLAPISTSLMLVAKPIPEVPPMTMAFLPVIFIISKFPE